MTCTEFQQAMFEMKGSNVPHERFDEIESHSKNCPPCKNTLTRIVEEEMKKELQGISHADERPIPPMTAECYCGHPYIAHVSGEFVNASLECLKENCDCRRFKWTTKDQTRFFGIKRGTLYRIECQMAICPLCMGTGLRAGVNLETGQKMTEHCRCGTPPNFYSFASPDRKTIRIDPTETFEVEMEFTPEMQEKLKRSAKRDCVICFGRGLHETPENGWKMCSCVEV